MDRDSRMTGESLETTGIWLEANLDGWSSRLCSDLITTCFLITAELLYVHVWTTQKTHWGHIWDPVILNIQLLHTHSKQVFVMCLYWESVEMYQKERKENRVLGSAGEKEGRKEGRKKGRKEGRTHLHRQREGGAMRRGEAGEGGVYGSRLQGLAKRGSWGRLHLWHPIHLI